MTNVLHVTVLGAPGTGKSSLLAALYQQFETIAETFDIGLLTEQASTVWLSEQLASLKAQAESESTLTHSVSLADPQDFTFEIELPQQNPRTRIVVHDFPGDWLASEDEDKLDMVESIARQSSILIVTLDTAALLEQQGRYNEQVNLPRQTSDFFARTFRRLQQDKLILFAPVKCESYVQNPVDAINLSLAVQAAHESLLYGFSRLENRVAVAITPVQTLGNVQFSHYAFRSGCPVTCFRTLPDSVYAPKYPEQILYYMLLFWLNRQCFGNMSDSACHLFSSRIQAHLKQGKGFVTLQGKPLLGL